MTNETHVPDAEGYVHTYNEDGELVRKEWPNGTVRHYKNVEHVRTEFPDGGVWHYKNGKLARIEFPDGGVMPCD